MRKLQPPAVPVRADAGGAQEAELTEEEADARAAALVGALLEPHMGEWGRLVASLGVGDVQTDMNRLWGLWTWLAEEVHIFVAGHDHEDATREVCLPDRRRCAKGKDNGRGTERMIQTTTLKPQRRMEGGVPVTVPLRECATASRSLRTVLI